MGKRRHSHTVDDDLFDAELDAESLEDGDESSESPKKKHKKSKHKKHKKSSDGHREHKKKKKEKKHREHEPEASGGLKLKIKFGGQTVATTNVNKASLAAYPPEEEESASEDGEYYEMEANLETADVEDRKREEDGDEEQKWLAALEAGELDDAGQLKSERNRPLTARQQRTLKQEAAGFHEELLELPMRRKEKEVTEEMLARRSEQARKRRLKQQKEQEEIKKQTVHKLITKQTKKKDDEKEVVARRMAGPRVQFASTADALTLSFPEGFDFPLAAKTAREPPKPVLCSADDCKQVKRYACSSNGLPVCSLSCYKSVLSRSPLASAVAS